jgi:hypothetical protein
MHENTRKTEGTRAAAISGDRFARCGLPSGRGGKDAWGFPEHRFPMEETVSACRSGRLESQASFRPQAQVNGQTTSKAGTPATERPLCQWVFDRPLDAETHRRANRQAVRRSLRPIRRLARVEPHGLELPETRASCPRTERASDCGLAKEGLAPHKKTPDEAAVASDSWTRAASCSSRWFVAPGLPKAARPFSTVGPDGIASRLFRRLRFRPSVADWACTSRCTTTTSVPRRWKSSWRICSNMCRTGLSWSWIGRGPIVRPLEGSGSGFHGVCTSNGCRHTPRSSTLTSKYGRGPSTEIWPISSHGMSSTLSKRLKVRSSRPRLSNLCCARFSSMQNSDYEDCIYLFKGQ